MQTCIKFKVVNAKTKETVELCKYWDGLLSLQDGTFVETGMWMSRIESQLFRARTDTLELRLEDVVEKNEDFLRRIETAKAVGWEV